MTTATNLARIYNRINLKEDAKKLESKWNIYQKIPHRANDFYHQLGLLMHPATGQPVKDLTAYQIESWMDNFRYKYNLDVKSQKIGLSTSHLMADFQMTVIPTVGHKYSKMSTMGFDTLLIAQSYPHAKEHMRTLYEMIVQSEEYRDYLVEKPSEEMIKTDRTKANIMIIRNPENPARPSRIIGLGPNASGIWSWKRVKRIHMSDVAAVDQIDDRQMFAAASSRLANTNGSWLIETPPRGEQGTVFKLYKDSKIEGSESFEAAKFNVREYPAILAVQAGLMTQEFLDSERERWGVLYGMLYECKFLNPATTWYPSELFNYDPDPNYVTY
ncbi:MAG: hypothetical protein O6761_06895 [Thaumarchaeota archaeon]|nr:hypothetical protein [Nitrososphaerota archaeon]